MTKEELKTDESKYITELVIKDELKKEAEEYFKSICEDYNEEYERTGKRHYFVGFDIKNAYIDSAEPRAKRIAELEMTVGTLRTFSNEQATCIERLEKEIKSLGERCLQLQKDKGNLIDENNELKAQIEKMKRCSICKFSSDLGYCKIRCNGGECNKMDKWELAND